MPQRQPHREPNRLARLHSNRTVQANGNISLPESLKSFVDARVKARGYGSHSEYLRDLVRKDELEAAKDKMRALLMTGLSSPKSEILCMTRYWSSLRIKLARNLAEQPRDIAAE